MHDGVDRLRPQRRVELVQAHIARQRVEHLAAVGDVGDQRADLRIVERLGVEVEHLVAALDQILDDMAAGLAAAAGEHDPLRHFVLHFCRTAPLSWGRAQARQTGRQMTQPTNEKEQIGFIGLGLSWATASPRISVDKGISR